MLKVSLALVAAVEMSTAAPAPAKKPNLLCAPCHRGLAHQLCRVQQDGPVSLYRGLTIRWNRFMMADQLRYDAQGAVWKGANTPNLDKLAASGARFMNQYSSTPTCTPARAGILTGQSPWNHGMLGYGAVAPVYPFEMPVALRAVGYTTASIGKDQYAPPLRLTILPHQLLEDTSYVIWICAALAGMHRTHCPRCSQSMMLETRDPVHHTAMRA